MDNLKHLNNLAWCKLDWDLPELSSDAEALIKQCSELPDVTPSDDVNKLIEKSNEFPIPFPIESVRLSELEKRKPIEVLKKNITSAYPLLHERVLRLMALFLLYKRKHGSDIEKALYKDMTVPGFIDRILLKRAMCFMSRHDKYMLRCGEKGNNGWEAIGTPKQKPPLTLDSLLSYDELKLSAMLFVSSYTTCINDGARRNLGVVNETNIEDNPVIIGMVGYCRLSVRRDVALVKYMVRVLRGELHQPAVLAALRLRAPNDYLGARRRPAMLEVPNCVIGPRFQREARMDCEDILVTEKQNCKENGYGDIGENSKAMWRKLWADFYEVPSSTYSETSPKMDKQPTKNQKLKKDERQYTDRYIAVGKLGAIFDNEAYHKRLSIIAEASLLEAETRARDANLKAYLNVIGAGLGVWKISPHQNDVFVLSFVQCIQALLKRGALGNVTDVNFAYIKATRALQAFFKSKPGSKVKTGFIEDKEHPNKGINIYLEDREPSAKLMGAHSGKLLVMTYPWDGNAHPGNEFWMGKLGSSGDPAAACSTQISELHNAYINPAVCSEHTRVVTSTDLVTLKEYAQML